MQFSLLAAAQTSDDTARPRGAGGAASKPSGKESDKRAKVWDYLFSSEHCPETGGKAPLTGSDRKIQFQSSQNLWIGGVVADGGVQKLETAAALEVACAGGKVKATPFCGQNRDLAKKGCDAAAKVYGLPSIYMTCKYAADSEEIEVKKPSSSAGGSKGSASKADSDARKSAEYDSFREAYKKYAAKMKGDSKKDDGKNKDDPGEQVKDDGVCQDYARKARTVLNRLEESALKSNFMNHSDGNSNCDFFAMIKLLAIAEKYEEELPNQIMQTRGSAIQAAEKPEYKKYLTVLMDCIDKASKTVKADNHEVGTCDVPKK
jgi:hypothetical protein